MCPGGCRLSMSLTVSPAPVFVPSSSQMLSRVSQRGHVDMVLRVEVAEPGRSMQSQHLWGIPHLIDDAGVSVYYVYASTAALSFHLSRHAA